MPSLTTSYSLRCQWETWDFPISCQVITAFISALHVNHLYWYFSNPISGLFNLGLLSFPSWATTMVLARSGENKRVAMNKICHHKPENFQSSSGSNDQHVFFLCPSCSIYQVRKNTFYHEIYEDERLIFLGENLLIDFVSIHTAFPSASRAKKEYSEYSKNKYWKWPIILEFICSRQNNCIPKVSTL